MSNESAKNEAVNDAPSNHQSGTDEQSLDPQNTLFSSIFFGWNRYAFANDRTKEKSSMKDGSGDDSSTAENPQNDEPNNGDKPNFNIDKYIPDDPEELRKTPLFRGTYKLIQWQRDNYLVGREYANWRRKERQQNPNETTRQASTASFELPYDPSALSHSQLATVAANFIPSDTVRNAALPLVRDLPMKVLYPITKDATVNLIFSQQDNLDQTVKNQLITFLKNPDNRVAIKDSTQGYIATKYRDNNSSAGSNDVGEK